MFNHNNQTLVKNVLCFVLLTTFMNHFAYCGNQPIQTLVTDNSIAAITFSPDGSKLLTGWKNCTVWDLATGQKILVLPTDTATCAAFSRDGKFVATGGCLLSAAVWNMEMGKQVQSFQGDTSIYSGPVNFTAIAFHPFENKIITGNEHGVISLWDIITGKEDLIVTIGNRVDKIQVFSDGDRILTYMDIISLKAKQILYKFDTRILLSSDEKYLFTGNGNLDRAPLRKQFLFYSAIDYSLAKSFSVFEANSGNGAFSPNGIFVLLYEFGDDFGNYDLTKIQLRRIENNELVHEFKVNGKNDYVINNAIFSSDGKKLAIVSDKTVYVWDISDLYSAVPQSADLKQ